MNIPNLDEIIQWFKDRMRPKDIAIGAGISDWDITAEYVPGLEVAGQPAYGALCSPGNHEIFPTQEDVSAKRAHFLIRPPSDEKGVKELRVTFFHECNHILQSMFAAPGNGNRVGMENQTHSMDNFLSQLTPDDIALFARHIPPEMARAYRAEEGSMPDATEDPKKPDKPAMAEGAPRDAAAISADIANCDPTDTAKLATLAVELRQALIAKAVQPIADNGPPSVKEPMAPPTMGMKPEDAYARKILENTQEAIGAVITAYGITDEKQIAAIRKMPTVKDASDLIAAFPRAANQNDQAKLGMLGNPKTDPKLGGAQEKPMARAMREGLANQAICRVMGIGSLNDDGVHVDPGGGMVLYIDGTKALAHQKAVYAAEKNKARGAA